MLKKKGGKHALWRENKIFDRIWSKVSFIHQYDIFQNKLFSFLCCTILSTRISPDFLRKKQGQDVDMTGGACSDQSPSQFQRGSRRCYMICILSGWRPLEVTILPFLQHHQSFFLYIININILKKRSCTKQFKLDCKGTCILVSGPFAL